MGMNTFIVNVFFFNIQGIDREYSHRLSIVTENIKLIIQQNRREKFNEMGDPAPPPLLSP